MHYKGTRMYLTKRPNRHPQSYKHAALGLAMPAGYQRAGWTQGIRLLQRSNVPTIGGACVRLGGGDGWVHARRFSLVCRIPPGQAKPLDDRID